MSKGRYAFYGSRVEKIKIIHELLYWAPGTYGVNEHGHWFKVVENYSWSEIKEIPLDEVPKQYRAALLLMT